MISTQIADPRKKAIEIALASHQATCVMSSRRFAAGRFFSSIEAIRGPWSRRVGRNRLLRTGDSSRHPGAAVGPSRSPEIRTFMGGVSGDTGRVSADETSATDASSVT